MLYKGINIYSYVGVHVHGVYITNFKPLFPTSKNVSACAEVASEIASDRSSTHMSL